VEGGGVDLGENGLAGEPEEVEGGGVDGLAGESVSRSLVSTVCFTLQKGKDEKVRKSNGP
jgi:hypothetical protein